MLEITEYLLAGEKISKLDGRIDGISSEDINHYIANLLDNGTRKIILDFESVNYISSAGLRVLLINQKKISSAGGDISFYKLTNSIKEVFKLSGFLKLFKIYENEDEIGKKDNITQQIDTRQTEVNGIKLEIRKISDEVSRFLEIGTNTPLESSSYNSSHNKHFNPDKYSFGLGLAAIGENWNEIEDYFGESVVLDGSIFVYPAVKRPAVDFMLKSQNLENINFSFLNGIIIDGKISKIVSFEMTESFIEIGSLLKSVSQEIGKSTFGFSLISECKGVLGMNIKKVPIEKNRPKNSKSIFDNENFADWINFPVEQDDFNTMLAGVGIYCNDKEYRTNNLNNLIPGSEAEFHLHCGIFKRNLMSFKSSNFDEDLSSIINELEPVKVQHIMPGTLMSMGSLAIFDTEG